MIWYNAPMLKTWLKFFRVVNLPTVPGDVLVGAAAVMSANGGMPGLGAPVAACVAAVFLYMFGLADNDIVGAKTDVGRPIPDGRISLPVARIACGLCLFGALIVGSLANLPPAWWVASFLLATAIVVYNRTKQPLVMGLCRGLNVLCGGLCFATQYRHMQGVPSEGRVELVCLLAVWTVYIAAITKYSEGEEMDAEKKRRVGFLIGAIVYLQLIALLVFPVKPFLVAGAVLLIVLRLMKRCLPGVSAS